MVCYSSQGISDLGSSFQRKTQSQGTQAKINTGQNQSHNHFHCNEHFGQVTELNTTKSKQKVHKHQKWSNKHHIHRLRNVRWRDWISQWHQHKAVHASAKFSNITNKDRTHCYNLLPLQCPTFCGSQIVTGWVNRLSAFGLAFLGSAGCNHCNLVATKHLPCLLAQRIRPQQSNEKWILRHLSPSCQAHSTLQRSPELMQRC